MSTNSLHHGILVGVDGSPYSDAAVRWAVGEAVMRNLQLSIVHVVSPLIGGFAGVGMSGAALPADLDQWLEQELSAWSRTRYALPKTAPEAPRCRSAPEIPFAPVQFLRSSTSASKPK